MVMAEYEGSPEEEDIREAMEDEEMKQKECDICGWVREEAPNWYSVPRIYQETNKPKVREDGEKVRTIGRDSFPGCY